MRRIRREKEESVCFSISISIFANEIRGIVYLFSSVISKQINNINKYTSWTLAIGL